MNLRYPVFAVVGPSQRGKSELIKSMLARFPDSLAVLKTISTRDPREPDDAIFYDLVSDEKFAAMKAAGVLTQGGNTEYAGAFYDNDRVTDDALLEERAGICAWVEPTVTLYRRLGYTVLMVRIVPDGVGWPPVNHKRAEADRKREVAAPPPNKLILNAYGKEGFARADDMLAAYIQNELDRRQF